MIIPGVDRKADKQPWMPLLTGDADECQDDVAKIDAALLQDGVDADIKAQAEDMRSQAVQLCGAGNLEEGLSMTAEAKVLLKVE